MKSVRTHRTTSRALRLIGCLAMAACDVGGPGLAELTEIERNRALWHAQGLDDYRYAVERLCFCGQEARGPVRVTVTDRAATARVYVESGEPVSEQLEELFPTVDGLFDVLSDAVARDAAEISMTFDPDTGVPLDISIDYQRNVADEELGFRVTEVPGPVVPPAHGSGARPVSGAPASGSAVVALVPPL